MALLLDPRTVNSLVQLSLGKEKLEGMSALRLYLDFANIAFDCEQKKREDRDSTTDQPMADAEDDESR